METFLYVIGLSLLICLFIFQKNLKSNKKPFIITLITITGSVIFYGFNGHPHLQDLPLSSRTKEIKVYEMMDNVRQLLKQMHQDLKKNPQDENQWVVLMKTYLKLNHLEKAKKYIDQALEHFPQSASLMIIKGEMNMQNHHNVISQSALDLFKKSLIYDPENAKAQYYLGLYAYQNQQKTKALSLWNQLIENQKQPHAQWINELKKKIETIKKAPISK